MKQILLRVPAVLSEVDLAKGAELCCGHFSFSGKIFLFQNALDPHVDRKCLQPLVGKKHHTISNLRAHARQLTQTRSQCFIRELAPLFKIDLGGNEARRRQQVIRPVIERARLQIGFREFCD
jgi:hypothetical protein